MTLEVKDADGRADGRTDKYNAAILCLYYNPLHAYIA